MKMVMLKRIKYYIATSVWVFLFCVCCFNQSQAQLKAVKIWNKMFNDPDTTKTSKFIAYPTLAYSPETSWEFGVSTLFIYHANKDKNNRLSEIGNFSFVTLEGQYGILFDHALYTDKDKWFALGKLKFLNFPLVYYGIGPDVSGEELAIANANIISIRERLLRKVYGNWYFGLEANYEQLSGISFDWFPGVQPEENIQGQNGYSNLGLGLGLVYDNRHNVLNVRHGLLSEIGYLMYQPAWGSTNRLNTLFLDNRMFFPLQKNNVLAGQFVGQFSQGVVPFNQLSMIGGEMMMRGYYLGRYRDKNMIAAQVEHRWLPFPFSKRLGGAVFAGIGSVSPNLNFNKLLWTAGGGLRILIFPQRDVYTRLDVGLNPDGYGVYLFIGEAF